ncbi:MAG: undecaprenyl-phosphate galactose phosphotransferase WbaP [Spirochaetaceae bacterium]|jgi:Undecaprenyl-phosphate galactose phosphotransferase WbaP|nr:undecaprenyl-phosphate galactose phosphotransferase WbaP [Spirochaetaceae bacterium]
MTLEQFGSWYHARFSRTSASLIVIITVVTDLLTVMASFGAGFFIINLIDLEAINFKSFVTFWPYLPLFPVLFMMNNLYPGISMAPAEELRHIGIASSIGHGGVILSRYINQGIFDPVSEAFILSYFFSIVIILMGRSIMRRIFGKARFANLPAVIYGSGDLTMDFVHHLLKSSKFGYSPALILDTDTKEDDFYGVPIIHDLSLGPELVRRFNIKMAMVVSSDLKFSTDSKITTSLAAFRYNVFISPLGTTNIWMSVREFDGILGFSSTNRLSYFWNRTIKRISDICFVIVASIILSPFFLVLALIIKISSPGPVLYAQMRIGRFGKKFKIYKFRTMCKDAAGQLEKLLAENPGLREEWQRNQKLKNDPRITAIGKFLRSTSIDEFPQFINVLKGDMSLIGPRPIVDNEISKYGDSFERIFSVRPGLSGFWQVSGRSDTLYSSRVIMDGYYLQNWSIWLDMWILFKTVWVVLAKRGSY